MLKQVPRKARNYHNKGFTVVELIIVIVLIGIVGAVVVSRFTSGSAFNAAGTQDAIISIAHATQQASLGRDNASLQIDASGGDWIISAVAGSPTVTIRSISIPATNVILETGSAVTSGNTCANAYDTAVMNDFVLNYNRKGDLVDFTNNGSTETVDASFNGVRLCINDNPVFSVCISPAGYAYEGDCDV